jgi:hypothetical protein
MERPINIDKVPMWIMDFVRSEVVYYVNHKELGHQMAKLREGQSMTLGDLSKRMEVTESYISLLEQGKRNWNELIINTYLKGICKL